MLYNLKIEFKLVFMNVMILKFINKTSKNTLKIKEFLKKYIKNKMFSPTHVFAIGGDNFW